MSTQTKKWARQGSNLQSASYQPPKYPRTLPHLSPVDTLKPTLTGQLYDNYSTLTNRQTHPTR